ncbi:MAG TPA: hypothetical protein VGK19_06725 [Capsulimonadaceae bacterium]
MEEHVDASINSNASTEPKRPNGVVTSSPELNLISPCRPAGLENKLARRAPRADWLRMMRAQMGTGYCREKLRRALPHFERRTEAARGAMAP